MLINLNNYVTFYVDIRHYDKVLEYFNDDKELLKCYDVTDKQAEPLYGYMYLKMQIHHFMNFSQCTSDGLSYIYSLNMWYSED